MNNQKVRTPIFPTYIDAKTLMQAGVGEKPQSIRDMIKAKKIGQAH